MNHLAHSSSLYLLQHAENPIDWYPWGEEAFEAARIQDKPIFISIGYATCYWCHVMEREVFCETSIGELMNKHFINIKIDREERPDLDALYMMARQLLTRQGGWPNNLILTPELKPFWAAGTLAIDRRYGTSFPEIATLIATRWHDDRTRINQAADEISHYLTNQLTTEPKETVSFDPALSEKLLERLTQHYDPQHGGFFSAPKFPHENYLLFLLKQPSKEALKITANTLDHMAAGGIYDHVGGGFHRYAVDALWQVPHFEKMLYNQSLLAKSYSEAYALTGNDYYRSITEHTLNMVLELFTGADGQFYSALDAETDSTEGKYYVWTHEEIARILNQEQAALFFRVFMLADVPEFAGHHHPDGGVITAISPALLQQHYGEIQPIMTLLKKERSYRQSPTLDTKVITSWHSMMMGAFAKAGAILNHSTYIDAAEKAAHYLQRSLMDQGKLQRTSGNDTNGFLEDYSNSINGLLELYHATHKDQYRDLAITLTEKACELFEDIEHGGFFYTEKENSTLLRIKSADDDALPSANGIMLQNLIVLAEITGNPNWNIKARRLLNVFYTEMEQSPVGYTSMIHGLMEFTKSEAPACTPSDPYCQI